MMNKKPPTEHAPRQEANTAPPGLYEKSDPIPVPEVIEDDQDASWGLWQQAVASQEDKPPVNDSFDNTQPMSLAELRGYTKPKTKP